MTLNELSKSPSNSDKKIRIKSNLKFKV